jgi:signal transduction histidine kinase
MKLLVRATLFYLLITFVVFGAGGIITYNIFLDAIQKETDRYLIERFIELSSKMREDSTITDMNDSKIEIIPVSYIPQTEGRRRGRFHFSDTLVWHYGLKRMENNRKLTTYLRTKQDNYKVEIHDVIVESDDIYHGVFKSQTRLFIILGLVMVISSFLISKWMFRPFDRTLEKIRNYNIKSLKATSLEKTGIKEFNILNGFVNQMTEKISTDYRNLKEFTENASHELQTPLAITLGKLELLLQKENLPKDEVDLINSSYEAISHMSKLNKSLTLLSKIENKEFSDTEEINLSNELKKAMDNFSELVQLKRISLESHIEEDVVVENDSALVKVLINNLLQNSIRHNYEGGRVKIYLNNEFLKIENTGAELDMPTEQLFERFKKGLHSEMNTGLGLSIVQKICELSHYQITYTNDKNWHIITVAFLPEQEQV